MKCDKQVSPFTPVTAEISPKLAARLVSVWSGSCEYVGGVQKQAGRVRS